ncbi:MAG: flagellar export chaperone FliS [Deltaproteobacteria bacterium]|nr:MAG: flagellar export chaperone FliS [Deltaproteobacteria bacterium]
MNGYGAYKRTSVETADQKSLILICYDEAIRSLQIGKDGFLKKAFEEKARQFIRAQDFISELLSSLDLEAGGEIARNLSDIYNFCLRHIMRGDINRDMKAIDDVIAMLSELRSAWAQLDMRPRVESRPEEVTGEARAFSVGA